MSEVGIFDIFFERLYEESFEDIQINSSWKFQARATLSHKMAALKIFCEITQKSSFNGQYSWRRRIISGNWNPLKNHEKYFLLHLNKLNILLENQILHILWIFIKPNVWYSWSLKILAIKRWMVSVQFNSANFTGPPFCGGWNKKLQTFSRHFFWEQPSKYCIAEFTAIFVCLLLSWSRRYSMKWSSNFNGP